MMILLFALALIASLRGWFPWALAAFLAPYAFAIADGQALAASSRSLLSMVASFGGVFDWIAAVVLAAMVVNPRD